MIVACLLTKNNQCRVAFNVNGASDELADQANDIRILSSKSNYFDKVKDLLRDGDEIFETLTVVHVEYMLARFGNATKLLVSDIEDEHLTWVPQHNADVIDTIEIHGTLRGLDLCRLTALKEIILDVHVLDELHLQSSDTVEVLSIFKFPGTAFALPNYPNLRELIISGAEGLTHVILMHKYPKLETVVIEKSEVELFVSAYPLPKVDTVYGAGSDKLSVHIPV